MIYTLEDLNREQKQLVEELLLIPHPTESEVEYLKKVLGDALYLTLARNRFVSLEKTIEGRAKNSLTIIKNHPNEIFKDLLLQVSINENGQEKIVASDPQDLETRLSGDNVGIFNLEDIGKLYVNPKPTDYYRAFILNLYAENLTLHVKNASDYEKNKEAAKLAMKDTLTGLYNQGFFYTNLEIEVNSELEHRTNGLSLILMDLDNFKSFNDKVTHLQGDKILKDIAYLLKSTVTKKRDIIARIGGDEFGIIMPRTNYENAIEKAEEIIDAVEQTYFEGEETAGKITACIGVCSTKFALEYEELYKKAEQAMYKSKKTKDKNKVTAYEPGL
ncbi:MAG: GGDEF domain-containing protein [Candidatus Nanoarchaeia archaeon]